MGEALCEIMPAFHTLKGYDYTAPFFDWSKNSIFKSMQKYSNVKKLLLSLNTEKVEVSDIIDFIIHIVCNCPKSEKTATQSRYVTAISANERGKKEFNDTTLRILTGKQHPQIKPQRFRKVWIWTFGWLVQQINPLYKVFKFKQNFRKTKIVSGKSPFFVIGPSCRNWIDCVNIGKRSKAAKLLFQLVLVLNWVKNSFPVSKKR